MKINSRRTSTITMMVAIVGLALVAVNQAGAAIVTLTPDTAHSTHDGIEGDTTAPYSPPTGRTQLDALNALLNDPFAYNPSTPLRACFERCDYGCSRFNMSRIIAT